MPTIKGETKQRGQLLLTMHLNKGFKQNEIIFLVTLYVKEEESNGNVHPRLGSLQKEFHDLMPEELLKVLPSRRVINY